MIKIIMGTDGEKIYSEFEHNNTTITENSLMIRELEKVKLELLDNFKYENDFEINHTCEEFDDDEEEEEEWEDEE